VLAADSSGRAGRRAGGRCGAAEARAAQPIIPVVAIAAVQFGLMLGGSVVIESVFTLHGVGYLAWESTAGPTSPWSRRSSWCSPRSHRG